MLKAFKNYSFFRSNSFLFKNQRGTSLTELMVTVAVTSIVVIGMSNALSSFYKEVNIANFKAILEGVHLQMRQNIMGDDSFRSTLNHALNMEADASPDLDSYFNCVRSNTTCTMQAPEPFVLMSPDGTAGAIFNGETGFVAANGVGTEGWDYQGRRCAGFDFTNGNDACPFSYGLQWQTVCPGGIGTTCDSPGIRIIARPFYRPSSSSGRTFSYNLNKYDIDLVRGLSTTNEAFVAGESFADPAGGGAGECTPTFTWDTIRQFNTEISDPLDNISVSAGTITLLKKGTYVCSLVVPGFGVGGFRIRIQTPGGTVLAETSVSAYAPTGIQSLARLDSTFTTTAVNTDIQVRMFCENTNGDYYDQGMAVPGAGNTYTSPTMMSTMSCRRVN